MASSPPAAAAGGERTLQRANQSTLQRDQTKPQQPWLDAWSDPIADVRAFSSCMCTCNLMGDGDWRLIIADKDNTLKIWRGTNKASEHKLLGPPIAVASFVPEAQEGPKVPSLVVAVGSCVYMYRLMRPYYKFVVPGAQLVSEEDSIWLKAQSGQIAAADVSSSLQELQQQGVQLAARSLELLSLADPEQQEAHIKQQGAAGGGSSSSANPATTAGSSSSNAITCMDVLRVASEDHDGPGCLVLGIEDGRLLILDATATSVSKTVTLGAPAAFLAVAGTLDAGYRITAAARDGKLYNVKCGSLSSSVIQLDAQAVGVVRIGKQILVATMASKVHCYSGKGARSYTLPQPSPIVALQLLALQNTRATKCLLVALANGDVRVYNDESLVSVHTLSSPVWGMRFGRYGREDHSLITINKAGALEIKVLPRSANLEAGSAASSGPPPEQDVPLPIPKKTKLYLEQAQREREGAVNMHRVFQRDLCKLRLQTARALVRVLTDGQGAAGSSAAAAASAHLSMTAVVEGLGPWFRLQLTVCNEGATMAKHLRVVLQYDLELYEVSRPCWEVPLLVPLLHYTYQVDVRCLDPAAGADTIKVAMVSPNSSQPLMIAVVQMPVSEPEEMM